MSKALTPENPTKLFAAIAKPYALFTGEYDELFDPGKIMQFTQLPSKETQRISLSQIVKNAKHLSIL